MVFLIMLLTPLACDANAKGSTKVEGSWCSPTPPPKKNKNRHLQDENLSYRLAFGDFQWKVLGLFAPKPFPPLVVSPPLDVSPPISLEEYIR